MKPPNAMSEIPLELVRHEVMSQASEDMGGLYEIVWALNVSHKAASKDLKLAVSLSAVRQLLSEGFITLHHFEWHPYRELGQVSESETEAVLDDPSSWEPGPTFIAFVATDSGRDALRRGEFALRTLNSSTEEEL